MPATNTTQLPTATRTRSLLRRGVLIAAAAGMLAGVVLAVPSLHGVRQHLTALPVGYLAVAVALEVGSCVSFAIVFRAFFDRAPAALARRIAWIEMGSGALLPSGGITSYALGGLLLSRAGMGRQEIITRSGGVFWLTTAINALAVVIGSLLLLLGVGGCPDRLICGGLPLLVAVALTVMIAASPTVIAGRPRLAERRWLVLIADGVADAWRAARHPSWRLIAALGYLGLDMAVLACLLRGLGYHVSAGVLMIGYLLGYAATMIPTPAGIGVLEGGLAGALVLYGAPPATTAAAVLLYHAIAFWIPSLAAGGAWIALVRNARSDRSADAASLPARPDRRPTGPVRRVASLALSHYGFVLQDPAMKERSHDD